LAKVTVSNESDSFGIVFIISINIDMSSG